MAAKDTYLDNIALKLLGHPLIGQKVYKNSAILYTVLSKAFLRVTWYLCEQAPMYNDLLL